MDLRRILVEGCGARFRVLLCEGYCVECAFIQPIIREPQFSSGQTALHCVLVRTGDPIVRSNLCLSYYPMLLVLYSRSRTSETRSRTVERISRHSKQLLGLGERIPRLRIMGRLVS